MNEDTKYDESIEGNRVIDADGEKIGVVSGVRDGAPYIDPNPDLTDRLRSMLGWEDVDRDDFPLRPGAIERTTDDEVHLKREF